MVKLLAPGGKTKEKEVMINVCLLFSSALWWMFYGSFYRRNVERGVADVLPIPLVQAYCGVLSAVLAATLTNPLDVIRTRYQVSHIRCQIRKSALLGHWFQLH